MQISSTAVKDTKFPT